MRRSGKLLSITLLAFASPALADPMPAAEFEQRFQALETPTALQCLDPAKRAAQSGDAIMDSCIAAVKEVEAAMQRAHPDGPVGGVYMVIDLFFQKEFLKQIRAADGTNTSRVCRTSEAMHRVSYQLHPYYYAEPVADQVEALMKEVEQLYRSCGNW